MKNEREEQEDQPLFWDRMESFFQQSKQMQKAWKIFICDFTSSSISVLLDVVRVSTFNSTIRAIKRLLKKERALIAIIINLYIFGWNRAQKVFITVCCFLNSFRIVSQLTGICFLQQLVVYMRWRLIETPSRSFRISAEEMSALQNLLFEGVTWL